MNVINCEALINAIESGSFTVAAEKMGYTQSGVSHMIKNLEKELGITLLSRDRAGIRVTSQGEKIIPYIKEICLAKEKIDNKIAELNGIKSGLIRVGTFSSVSAQWLPKIIKKFNEKYPKIEFDLIHGDYYEIEDMISEGNVDCGFIRLPSINRLQNVFLKRDKLVAILPKEHPLADSRLFPIRQVAEYPFIEYNDGKDNEIRAIYDDYHIKPHKLYSAMDDYAIMAMVECGLGVSILPQLILRKCPYDILTKDLDEDVHRDIAIAFLDEKNLSPATAAFVSYISDISDEL